MWCDGDRHVVIGGRRDDAERTATGQGVPVAASWTTRSTAPADGQRKAGPWQRVRYLGPASPQSGASGYGGPVARVSGNPAAASRPPLVAW